MAYQKKSYKKFVATAASATLVASAIVPVASAASFSDVEEKHEFATYIDAAVEAGYVKGYADGTFGINDNLKRSQVVIIIGRYLESLGYESEETTSPWSDVTDEEVIKYGNIVKDAGVFTGYKDGTLKGNDFITRENMAVVLDRLAETVTGTSLSDVAEYIEDIEVADLATANAAYQSSIQALRDLEISTADNFNPKGNLKRGQFAKFIINAVETIDVLATVTAEDIAQLIAEVEAALPAVEDITADNAEAVKEAVEAAKEDIAAIKEQIEVTGLTGEEVAELEAMIAEVEAKFAAIIEAADKAIEAAKPLVVESVSAINPTEIQIKFNTPVDSATARDLSNYVFTTASAGAAGATPLTGSGLAAIIEPTSLVGGTGTILETSELSADKKTITLKLKVANSLKNSESYSVDVVNKILSDDKKSFVERHKDTVKTFNDLQAASLKSVTYAGTDLELVFDEPVTSITGLKIDDTNVSIGTPQYSVKTGEYTVVVPGALSNPSFATPGNHTVVVYGVADTAKKVTTLDPNTATVLSGSYTVSTDTVKPTVVSIKPVATNPSRAFDIKFSERVTTVAASELELEIKKGNFVFGNTSVSNADHYTVALRPDGKTYRVTFTANTATTNVNPLYGETESSVSLSVKVKGYKDLANNVGDEYTGAVTLAKDLVGPAVKDGLENRLESSNQLVVKFNKIILTTGLVAGQVDVNKLKVTDKDGIERTVTSAVIQNDDELLVTLAGSWGTTELSDKAPYTVTVAAGAVKSVDEVKNAQTVATIKPHVSSAAVEPFAGTITPGNASVNGVVVNTITVDYTKPMNASAFDLANYSLDNVKLNTIPGAKITANNTNTTATITLPEGFTKASNTKVIEISTNVKTAQGAVIVNNVNDKQAYVHATPLSFTDNTQPVLVKAEYLVSNATTQTETKRIKLTFSEAVTGGDTDDLTIKVGNATKAYSSISAASGEPNALIVTLNENLALTNTATITVNEHTATKAQTITDVAAGANNVAKALTITLNANTKTLDADAIAGNAANQQAVTAANNLIAKVNFADATSISNAQTAVDAIPDATSKAKAQKDLNEKVGVVANVVSQGKYTPEQTAALANSKVTFEQKANVITVTGFKDVSNTTLFDSLYPSTQQNKKYVEINLARPTGSSGTAMKLWKDDRGAFQDISSLNGQILAWVDTTSSDGKERTFYIDWTGSASTKDQATVYTIKFVD